MKTVHSFDHHHNLIISSSILKQGLIYDYVHACLYVMRDPNLILQTTHDSKKRSNNKLEDLAQTYFYILNQILNICIIFQSI
jgi:hypothetical protein